MAARRPSNSLAAIFAANDRRLADDRKRQAATARAEAKRGKASGVGPLIGAGLGATSLLFPATAPFVVPAMTLGSTAGGVAERALSGGDPVPTAGELITSAGALLAPVAKSDDKTINNLLNAFSKD